MLNIREKGTGNLYESFKICMELLFNIPCCIFFERLDYTGSCVINQDIEVAILFPHPLEHR